MFLKRAGNLFDWGKVGSRCQCCVCFLCFAFFSLKNWQKVSLWLCIVSAASVSVVASWHVWLIDDCAEITWHLSYNDRWAAAISDKWLCLSPIETLAQSAVTHTNISHTLLCVLTLHTYSRAAKVSCHLLHHKLKRLTCPCCKPENQWGLFFPEASKDKSIEADLL